MEDDLLLWPTPFELAFSFFLFLDNDVACYVFMFLKIVINYKFYGSFENEALENEDRSTKHPNLENEAPKTRKRSTLDRKRSTQYSKPVCPL